MSHMRIAPRKARMVADLIRGRRVEEALNLLKFTPKRAAPIFSKLVQSAVANATDQGHLDVDTLYVKSVTVDPGPTLKRFLPRAMGRATTIRKRMSHLKVVLAQK